MRSSKSPNNDKSLNVLSNGTKENNYELMMEKVKSIRETCRKKRLGLFGFGMVELNKKVNLQK